MPRLRFPDHALVLRMVEHCVASGDPLMLAHDEGVYLCIDAIRDSGGRCVCAYAAGCDPRPGKDADWFDAARRLVGGDDFGERLSLLGATRLLDALRAGERLLISINRNAIEFLTERVAPITPGAACGRGNGSPNLARHPERNSDMSKTNKKASKRAKPTGEALKKQALKEIAERLADGKQDHEVPTAKEIANTPHKPQATKVERNAKTAKAAKVAARALPIRLLRLACHETGSLLN